VLQAAAGQSLPPATITGARGWVTGYTAPVLSGTVRGELRIGPDVITVRDAAGYHDHNWGFWRGVSWQWGQAQQGDLSLIYGRVFPPPDAADPARIPGFVGALGPDGPLGYATDVTIDEMNDPNGQPRTITVTSRGRLLDVRMQFDVGSVVMTRMTQGTLSSGLSFLQMRGQYTVTGHAGEREINFVAPGSAETFRENSKAQIPNPKSQ